LSDVEVTQALCGQLKTKRSVFLQEEYLKLFLLVPKSL
jgi:hypothetical protein